MSHRVVITGVGAVTPLGNDVPSFWRALCAGESGVEPIEAFPTEKLRSNIAANVRDFDASAILSPKEQEIYGRVTQFSAVAAMEAMTMAGLGSLYEKTEGAYAPTDLDRSRLGCLMSTGMGSVDVFEVQTEKSRERGPRAVSPFFIPAVMPNSATALIAMRYGLMGPSYSLASACATGTHSIATSAMMIRAGMADVMVAGGAEAATRLNTVAGFGNARALARAYEGDPKRSSRPFDKNRIGFVMGEGAGVLVLESESHAKARGATPLAVVEGMGLSTDAAFLTRPHPDGLGLRFAMEKAIADAGLTADAIDYINPHATSTPQGDVAEVLALRRVFGERLREIPISATKSMIGHLLGGAGAVESIAVVCSMRDRKIHPSINVDELDPQFSDLCVIREVTDRAVHHTIKLSAGFGGHNCALVLGAA